MESAIAVMPGCARGPILSSFEPLSFWGGVDPMTGLVIDAYHPLCGRCLTKAILMIPSSRGSCTGSGVLLDLILRDRGPAAIVFSDPEDVLTLGGLIAHEMFGRRMPILRLSKNAFEQFSVQPEAEITMDRISAGSLNLAIEASARRDFELTRDEQAMLAGESGDAASLAMRVICAMALQQGATRLIPVSQCHVDGCIYASQANLIFAERMLEIGAKVVVPTTMNAISVDHANWRTQGVLEPFGENAQRLADCYVRMGCRPTFTCAPYLLENPPALGEIIAWAESNAVIYANSMLGARTPKHPDFLDLCIAITGRAPLAGVYFEELRKPRIALDIELPRKPGKAFWPLIGYLAGAASPIDIPILRGLEDANPGPDEVKALCAAFGTTSAAPMLHIEGVTPEFRMAPADIPSLAILRGAQAAAWDKLNGGPPEIDLIAIGSPHASLDECRSFARGLREIVSKVPIIITVGRDVIEKAKSEGTLQQLQTSGVKVIPDLCWCSISEPVFPATTRTVLTNSGKYAHYGPGLSGRRVRFGDLDDCIAAARTGNAPPRRPEWLA